MFFPKSWPASIQIWSAGTPSAAARSARATTVRTTSATTSSYSMRCGSSTRCHAAGVGAHEPGAVLGRNSGQVGIRSTPRVIEDGRPGPQTAAPTSCRQVSTLIGRSGYASRTAATKSRVRVDLLGDIDLVTWGGLDSADIDDVGPVTDDVVHSLHGGVECERRAAVVERVRRAIDDRHDLQGLAQLGFLFAQALIGRSFQSSVLGACDVRSLYITSPRQT